MSTPDESDYALVHTELVALVESARTVAARRVNALMSAVYWEIGRRIVETEQGAKDRPTYGEGLIEKLALDLGVRFGRGFSATNLRQMRAFHLAWPPEHIQQTVSADSFDRHNDPASRVSALAEAFPLPWSSYVRLLRVSSNVARTFYEREAIHGGWSVRQLRRQIDSQFYERAALSRDKEKPLSGDQGATTELASPLTPEEAIRDPYVLEFLDLKDEYSESDLEAALIERLTDFLLELGDDFAFVGRQRRPRLDDSWFRVDLVFFHRRLRCLVIIDLKVGRLARRLVLYQTSVGHAGEWFDEILGKRESGLPVPILMSDALSSNHVTDKDFVISLCNSHGRRGFAELALQCPEESLFALELYAGIWVNDDHCKEQGFDPQQRQAYHHAHSLPLMAQIRQWCQTQTAEGGPVEPNSNLGRAMAYFDRHYDGLCAFCHTPGAALDNNECERIIKLMVRGRKNSQFFKTENGAQVSDTITSILATCMESNVDALAYLVAVQRNQLAVRAAPQNWMPWNYPSEQ